MPAGEIRATMFTKVLAGGAGTTCRSSCPSLWLQHGRWLMVAVGRAGVGVIIGQLAWRWPTRRS